MTTTQTPSIETATPPSISPPREPGGPLEWLWRTRALERARKSRVVTPASVRQRAQRAQLASEFAERLLDPVEPLRAGSSIPLALSTDREAAYWALLAQDAKYDAADLRGAFAAVPRAILLHAAGGEEELEFVRSALVGKTFVDTANEAPESVERQARAVRAFVAALLRQVQDPEQHIQRLLLERWLRSVGLAVVLGVGGLFAASLIQDATLSPNIAEGKPWRASSSAGTCDAAQRRCLGTPTAIFFHTVEEENPWVELDLGAPKTFSVVEVQNRTDCCPDRAVPLVIEVSNDQKRFTEVARRPDTFTFWKAEFKPTVARYVRARVARRSLLHLESIAVRAK